MVKKAKQTKLSSKQKVFIIVGLTLFVLTPFIIWFAAKPITQPIADLYCSFNPSYLCGLGALPIVTLLLLVGVPIIGMIFIYAAVAKKRKK